MGQEAGCKTKKEIRYVCSGPSCSEVFGTMSLLNEHYKVSHERVECNNCGLNFNTSSTLSWHMYSHQELKYEWSHCQRKFPFASDRDIHELKHQTEKKFKCQHCDESFFMKGDCKKHEETHKNIKHKCTLCTYETVDLRNLKAHQRVHSNLKPYMCTYCLELFRFHTQLKRHLAKPCTDTSKMDDSSSRQNSDNGSEHGNKIKETGVRSTD